MATSAAQKAAASRKREGCRNHISRLRKRKQSEAERIE
jgi:hypothetical protein